MTEIKVLTIATGAETMAKSLKKGTPKTEMKNFNFEIGLPINLKNIYFLLTQRARCKIDKIQSGVEKFVEETHESKDSAISIVNMHNWIFIHVNEFMRSFALQN